MATLLAKKLTNAVNAAAEQAGITLECDLKNFRNDGERRAAGCKGEIKHPTTRARVFILSSESCPDMVRLEIISKPDDLFPDERESVPNHAAAQKIIELLTPPAISHENLASANITNLPNLSGNPLLASYLCDTATCTETWTQGRIKLHLVIDSQGFSPDDFAHYPPSCDDKAFEVANVLWSELAQSCTEPHMVAHHLLAYHDVRSSETVQGRLAYYQDDAKRKAGIRTPIKVRKYLQKFFGEFRSPEALERVACLLDELMQGTDKYDVRVYTDADVDGWADAYYQVNSCMSTQTKAYGVGELDTYRCYCTAAMTGGAKSSGLSLVVLYQDGKPVARSITYASSCGEKCYVKNYGDDRLVKWLDDNGYEHQQRLPRDTWLWTKCHAHSDTDYLSPYVDGDDGDAVATLEVVDGQPYWVISDDGAELQNCCGYTSTTILTCGCCGESISEGDEYDQPDLYGNNMTLCYSCVDNHCHTVDGDTGVYVSEGDLGDLIYTRAQGYFTQEYLDDRDWVVTGDGCVIDWCDAEYCEHTDEYYDLDAFQDISLEPGYVQKTWNGYVNDNGRVYDYFYRQYGVYINELDTYVHKNHVDDVTAYLASERTSESESASANESEA